MLKLCKVDLLGFKSFCEKTHIRFSGGGITCIVGPNGCGKSNIVDAISWVLGEQSHKLLRAERMSDCIFNGTVKRPPLGLAEVSLTLVEPELAEAAATVLGQPEEAVPENQEAHADAESPINDERPWKKRAKDKDVPAMKPGEVVVGRRLYRSGESEYLINGRVARLRDVQELFMGMGLGPDSYAIIEQGRIGQVLNSKPMDRRAIIEEAAGVTMYKTKRRLAEAKLEASKLNLSRVNDILVEVEKQLASLKRQASKARRYTELREQMRGLLRKVLASKSQHLDSEAERLESLLRELASAEERETAVLRELEAEQERLGARTYELDAELRRTQNLLGQSALDLDRAENRIAFNREQVAQFEVRHERLAVEIAAAEGQIRQLEARIEAHRESLASVREQAVNLEAELREALKRASSISTEQGQHELCIEELRQEAVRLGEEAVRSHAESLQAEEAAGRANAAEEQQAETLRQCEIACAEHAERAQAAERHCLEAAHCARQSGEAVSEAQFRLAELRRSLQETNQQYDLSREALSAERARRASLEQILNERAYTAEAVQKLFSANGEAESHGFRAVGLLADYAEVEPDYEAAIEQFLREELEYIVVETFDHARAGIALLRDEMGGRATFFVDSLRSLQSAPPDPGIPFGVEKGIVARLDRLVEFRDPLGSAAKEFLPKLRSAFLVDTATSAEKMAREYPHHQFLTPDGTCYHGRMVSGGRPSEAGPLALKRELRLREAEATRLEKLAAAAQEELALLEAEIVRTEKRLAVTLSQHVEAEKNLVAATHLREQARTELRRHEEQLAESQNEIERLRSEAGAAREHAERAWRQHAESLHSREVAQSEASGTAERLAALRQELQIQQEQLAARREELAAMAERLASAKAIEERMTDETRQAQDRMAGLREQRAALGRDRHDLEASSGELTRQVETFRTEKARFEERKAQLEREWEESRYRTLQLEDTLRNKRQAFDELRNARSQREIEKARNDSDREYMHQTCVAELNSLPEELIGQEVELASGEELTAAENSYNDMKARVESMGPVNMMALEEYQECEEREGFLRRERDDLVQSIENTQMAIAELDEVSRQKFEEAFGIINSNFATAFQALFGGGTGEMRLTEPDSSGESGIDIVAQPPGKRLQNIMLLSGGEKALTALALLIAVFRYQPSPFCILDEVDAPLDEANVGRFIKLLLEMGEQTQFIVVTHNRKTMETGSVLYGVTMQEPGVSKLVSVRWEEPAAAGTATNAA